MLSLLFNWLTLFKLMQAVFQILFKKIHCFLQLLVTHEYHKTIKSSPLAVNNRIDQCAFLSQNTLLLPFAWLNSSLGRRGCRRVSSVLKLKNACSTGYIVSGPPLYTLKTTGERGFAQCNENLDRFLTRQPLHTITRSRSLFCSTPFLWLSSRPFTRLSC